MYRTLNQNNIVISARDYLISRRWPSDEEFLSGWQQLPIYSSGTQKCRHILESLEGKLTTNHELVDLSHNRITIEHIMPQVLSTDWKSYLGENHAAIHETYLHTIGNLTLTGTNEIMGNQSFERKKITLEQSNLALNKNLIEQDYWNVNEIVCRAEELGALALQIWRRPE
jgi:hypothetical protein